MQITAAGEVIHVEATTAADPHLTSALHRKWTLAVDRLVGHVVEPAAAAIIVAEVVILASGVFSRYVLHNALMWTDELATFLLRWLTMLGAVIAYRRGEHMRLNVVLRLVSPSTRQILEMLSSLVVAIFCLDLIPAGISFYDIEKIDISPVLGWPRSLDIAALVTALSLLLVLAALRLIDAGARRTVPAIVIAAAVSWAAIAAHPWIASLGNVNLVIFFVGVVGTCVAIGVPIAFAFGFGTLGYISLAMTATPLNTIVDRMDEGFSNIILLAIPLFVLLGGLVVNAGIARRLVDALASLCGHLRGGLNMVLVGAMFLVSGISGSKLADMAAVAPVLFPQMELRGQKRSEMIALLAASGAMAETIPPSLVLIIIGIVAGISIQGLFTGGLLPAVVASAALIAVALIRSRNDGTVPAPRASWHKIGRSFFVAIPGLLLPVVIRYFVIAGIATATEVSTVGVIYSLLVGVFIYREFSWKSTFPMLRETASLTGAIMLIIATATAMGWAITQSGFAQQLADVLKHSGGATGFIALSIVLFIVFGSMLEGIPTIVLFGPLLFPIARDFHINDIHYAIIVVLAMGIGLFAPPVGIGYYGACIIGKTPPDAAVKPIIPYLLALLAALIVVAAIPWISTAFLPSAR